MVSKAMVQHPERFFARRLVVLYDAAKRRNGGQSLNVYSEVSTLLDYLEGVEPTPEGMNLLQAADALCYKLRQL